MNVKCIKATNNLTFGKSYEIIDSTETCHRVRNDSGSTILYHKDRFVGQLWNGECVCVHPRGDLVKGEVYKIEDGHVYFVKDRRSLTFYATLEEFNNVHIAQFKPHTGGLNGEYVVTQTINAPYHTAGDIIEFKNGVIVKGVFQQEDTSIYKNVKHFKENPINKGVTIKCATKVNNPPKDYINHTTMESGKVYACTDNDRRYRLENGVYEITTPTNDKFIACYTNINQFAKRKFYEVNPNEQAIIQIEKTIEEKQKQKELLDIDIKKLNEHLERLKQF